MLRAACYVLRAGCDLRRAWRWGNGVAVGAALALVAGACGDSPTKPDPPPPPPPVVNTAPVIDSVTVSATRVEADTDVTVTAAVRDVETPIDQLAFSWAADAGTFTGTGATVRWRVPKGNATPADQVLRLTVTETYGPVSSTGTRSTHAVNATSPAVRVHDSTREIGDMALRFLKLFATSTVGSDIALQEFSDSCNGKRAEKSDIDDNRRDFTILSSTLNLTSARVTTVWARGDATVRCGFSSRRQFCPPGSPASCRVGAIESVEGNCNLSAVYEQQRWLLCDSTFQGSTVSSYGFFGRNR